MYTTLYMLADVYYKNVCGSLLVLLAAVDY